jgi:hypothetical protein
MKRQIPLVLFASLILVAGCKQKSKSLQNTGNEAVTPADARSIAKDAYIYGVPMVAQYKAIYAFSIDKNNPQYKGPFNSILNFARVFTPSDTAFVTPNSDTPYLHPGGLPGG